jgi:hypothetical protein
MRARLQAFVQYDGAGHLDFIPAGYADGFSVAPAFYLALSLCPQFGISMELFQVRDVTIRKGWALRRGEGFVA